jgi:hypothetical protein
MDLYDELQRPDRRSAKNKHRTPARQLQSALERERQFGDFTCGNCRWPVSADPAISGVNNRNHCPYCLCSKHVDLYEPGDRLSACKGMMKAVGLAVKPRHKQYAPGQPGELLIVHRCAGCGTLSINRLAADDSPAALWDVFGASLAQLPGLSAIAQPAGIDLLGHTARALVHARLFGRGG